MKISSLAAILGITFIVLKVTGAITWDWLWVLAPLWIGTAIWVGLLAVIGLGTLLMQWGEGKSAVHMR